jgi:hypothetical protein
MHPLLRLLVSLPLAALACNARMGDPEGTGNAGPDGAPEQPTPDAGPPPADASPIEACTPPQLMIVLDRSGSFARRPDGTLPPNSDAGKAETRWHIAVHAVQSVSAELETKVQFGLALFPNDPDGAGGYDCSNLDTWLEEYLPPESNDLSCQPGEVLVSPAHRNGDAIAAAIGRDSTGLCSYTPIGAGLAAAQGELASMVTEDIDQFAVLITDGADTCDGDEGYATDSLATADAMAAAGVKTFVVGFDGTGEDLDPAHLNDLACAGGTAVGFATNCQDAGGGFRAVAEPDPARLYQLATEAESLHDAIAEIGENICCDCVD